MLCFLALGETYVFSFGFFLSKLCFFALVLFWRFVLRHLALFFFRLVGYLCGRLGLSLGSPGLVGPPWARGCSCCFLLIAALSPKMVTWILPKCTKTHGLGTIYAQRAVHRNHCQRASLFRKQLFSRVFWGIPAGDCWLKIGLLMRIWRFHSALLMFFRAPVLFFLGALGLDWVDLQARLVLSRPEIDAGTYGRRWDLQDR